MLATSKHVFKIKTCRNLFKKEDKSLWEPVQNITWLGTVFDTDRGFLTITESRISKLKSSIKQIRKVDCKIVKVRDLASVVGQVISLTHCVGSVARIMTRCCC